MSANTDFSRRFFADFIASRLKARGLEEAAKSPRRVGVTDAAASTPGAPGHPITAEARPTTPRPETPLQ